MDADLGSRSRALAQLQRQLGNRGAAAVTATAAAPTVQRDRIDHLAPPGTGAATGPTAEAAPDLTAETDESWLARGGGWLLDIAAAGRAWLVETFGPVLGSAIATVLTSIGVALIAALVIAGLSALATLIGAAIAAAAPAFAGAVTALATAILGLIQPALQVAGWVAAAGAFLLAGLHHTRRRREDSRRYLRSQGREGESSVGRTIAEVVIGHLDITTLPGLFEASSGQNLLGGELAGQDSGERLGATVALLAAGRIALSAVKGGAELFSVVRRHLLRRLAARQAARNVVRAAPANAVYATAADATTTAAPLARATPAALSTDVATSGTALAAPAGGALAATAADALTETTAQEITGATAHDPATGHTAPRDDPTRGDTTWEGTAPEDAAREGAARPDVETRVPGLYEGLPVPTNLASLETRQTEFKGFRFTDTFASAADHRSKRHTLVTEVTAPDGSTGSVTTSYTPSTGRLNFERMELSHAIVPLYGGDPRAGIPANLRWLPTDPPMVPGRGTPLVTAMFLRHIKMMDAVLDGRLRPRGEERRTYVMAGVVNSDSVLQMARAMRDGATPREAVQVTKNFRLAKSRIVQSGGRIVDIAVVGGLTARIDSLYFDLTLAEIEREYGLQKHHEVLTYFSVELTVASDGSVAPPAPPAGAATGLVRTRVPGLFENLPVPHGLAESGTARTEYRGYVFTDEYRPAVRSPEGEDEVETRVVAPDGTFGTVVSRFDPSTRTLIFKRMELSESLGPRDKAPANLGIPAELRWLRTEPPMVPERGTPLVTAMFLRQMRILDDLLGDVLPRGDERRIYRMDDVVLTDSILHMGRAELDGVHPNIAVRGTRSFQLAESRIVQSGGRIVDVRVRQGTPTQIRNLGARMPLAEISERYGLGELDHALFGFDVDLTVVAADSAVPPSPVPGPDESGWTSRRGTRHPDPRRGEPEPAGPPDPARVRAQVPGLYENIPVPADLVNGSYNSWFDGCAFTDRLIQNEDGFTYVETYVTTRSGIRGKAAASVRLADHRLSLDEMTIGDGTAPAGADHWIRDTEETREVMPPLEPGRGTPLSTFLWLRQIKLLERAVGRPLTGPEGQ